MFQIYNWSCVSSSLNQGLVSAAIDTPSSNLTVLQGSMNLFSYYSASDTVAQISASNYFLEVINSAKLNDVIMITGTDGSTFLQVSLVTLPTAGSSGTINVVSFTAVGLVGTANIANLAVTSAKIANNAVGFTQLAAEVGQLAQVALTSAQLLGMYAAPVVLVAAPGAGVMLYCDKFVLDIAYVSTQYAAGGPIQVQYNSTINGGGIAASASIAAATLNAVAASSQLAVGPVALAAANAAVYNQGLYLSNSGAAFTTGDSTATAYVYYKQLAPL